MSVKNSRDNLLANIAQQLSGLLIAIVSPLILGVEEYAEITVVSVLISFIALADLGMSTIYTRKLPALYSANSTDKIRAWNATLGRFKLFSGLIFAILVSIYYLQRYHHALNAIILFSMVALTTLTLFVSSNAIVQSDFRYIKNITIAQAGAKLTILPGVWVAGVKGWFLGQLFGTLVMFLSKKMRTVLHDSLTDHASLDWALVRENIVQALMLSLITTLWLQLSFCGRIYAAFFYSDVIVAQYGLVNSIYQIVVAMSIAAFVPQTIKIYRQFEEDQAAAINYSFKLAIYSAPIFMIFGIALTYMAPWVIETLFPKYNVDRGVYAPLMFSLFNCPIMVTQGALLVAFGKAKHYLAAIIIVSAAYFGYVNILAKSAGYNAAAIAQLLTLSTYSVLMLLLVYFLVKEKAGLKCKVALAIIPSLVAPLIYFLNFY